MIPTLTLPDDAALRGLGAIRTLGLARAIPSLELGAEDVELRLCGYSKGERATLDARAGDRRLAVKIYANDPAPEAELYLALGAAGLAGDTGPRVPALVTWARDLHVLVIRWLEGRAANEMIRDGQGKRAGELAARWLAAVAPCDVRCGPPVGAAVELLKARNWVDVLAATAPELGRRATQLLAALMSAVPTARAPRLVHGTFYARHVLDLGDAPGVIDWQRFGQGPLELDAGVFLATVTRHRLLRESSSGEAGQAIHAFLECTRTWLDPDALAWYSAAALLHLAQRQCKPSPEPGRDRSSRARALLDEGTRILETKY